MEGQLELPGERPRLCQGQERAAPQVSVTSFRLCFLMAVLGPSVLPPPAPSICTASQLQPTLGTVGTSQRLALLHALELPAVMCCWARGSGTFVALGLCSHSSSRLHW